jgi:hypothetical protein
VNTRGFTRVGNWVGLGVGALGGFADTIASEQDAKNISNAVAAGKKQSMLKQYGTYVNYVVPVAEILLTGFEVVREDLGVALMTSAGALAGAKLTRNFTMAPFGSKKNYTMVYSSTPSAWSRDMGNRWAPPPVHQDIPVPIPGNGQGFDINTNQSLRNAG